MSDFIEIGNKVLNPRLISKIVYSENGYQYTVFDLDENPSLTITECDPVNLSDWFDAVPSSDFTTIIFTRKSDDSLTINTLNPLGTFDEPEQGKKSDDNKPPMELLPSNGLIEVAKAMGYGAKKYNESWPDMNWPKVKNAKRRYLGAALRHIMARLGGEVRDPESGELHVAHAAFCLLALCEFDGGYRKESK